MRAMFVEVGREIEQLVFEVCRRPEQHVIQVFPPQGADHRSWWSLRRVEAQLVGGPGFIGDGQRLVVVNTAGWDECGDAAPMRQNPLDRALA